MNFNLVRDAHVSVNKVMTHDGGTVANIVINDQYEHRFSAKSRISKHLDLMTTTDLSNRLSGGDFFMVDDKLIDFRDSSYNGFIHTDQSLVHLMDTIGVSLKTPRRAMLVSNSVSSDIAANIDIDDSNIILRKDWDTRSFKAPGYDAGGEMESKLFFNWNPFMQNIRATYELIRLICDNGAVGVTPIFNGKIPLVNRWQEHLDIANDQIQQTIADLVSQRMLEMKTQRSSLYQATLVSNHAYARMKDPLASLEDVKMLHNLSRVVDPEMHLSNVYNGNVFEDTRLSKQVPSHLTAIDLYNIVTEIRSHTAEGGNSSARSLDGLANELMFNNTDKMFDVSINRYSSAAKLSSFSDPEQAFFNTVH